MGKAENLPTKMDACLCVCVYVCACVCRCVHMHVSVFMFVCLCVYVREYVWMRVSASAQGQVVINEIITHFPSTWEGLRSAQETQFLLESHTNFQGLIRQSIDTCHRKWIYSFSHVSALLPPHKEWDVYENVLSLLTTRSPSMARSTWDPSDVFMLPEIHIWWNLWRSFQTACLTPNVGNRLSERAVRSECLKALPSCMVLGSWL